MAQVIFTIPNISCEHCKRTISRALTPVEGVQSVRVHIPTQQVQVDYDSSQVTVEKMKVILQEEDYPVASTSSDLQRNAEESEVVSAGSGCSCCG